MSSSKETASHGIGLGGLLFVLFITLKLSNITVVATWSWWWVTAPLWMSAALVLGFLAVVLLICVGIIAALD